MSNNIFSPEELDNMYIIINTYRNLVPDELNRDLRMKLNTICEKIMTLKEESGSARPRDEGQPDAGTSHEDVIDLTYNDITNIEEATSGPVQTPQSQPTSTSQPQLTSTSQPQPTPTSQPQPTPTSQPQPTPTSQPQPTNLTQPVEITSRRRTRDFDEARPGPSRLTVREHNPDDDNDNATVSSREDTSLPNRPTQPARIKKRRDTVQFKTFSTAERGETEGFLTFYERKKMQGQNHNQPDEVIFDTIIRNSNNEELKAWARNTNCKDMTNLLNYIVENLI